METDFKIAEFTGFEQLALWRQAQGPTVRFRVHRDSGFCLAVEGVALATLDEIRRRSAIEVECTFEPTNDTDLREGLLTSLFGLALIFSARVVRTPASTDVRKDLIYRLWSHVVARRGLLGDGKRKVLVSRDPDSAVPKCLSIEPEKFPMRDRFGSVLFSEARALGGISSRRQFSRTEEELITFVYEAARNSFEHARIGGDGKAISGIRGILLEKKIFHTAEEVATRRDLTELQRAYIASSWSRFARTKKLMAYSVVDLGPGIHNTIPASEPSESPWNRLIRAFEPGHTRKSQDSDIEAGMGLPKLFEAATRLHALLLVVSAELSALVDFSMKQNAKLEPWLEPEGATGTGTSLTLICPDLEAGGDQGLLF